MAAEPDSAPVPRGFASLQAGGAGGDMTAVGSSSAVDGGEKSGGGRFDGLKAMAQGATKYAAEAATPVVQQAAEKAKDAKDKAQAAASPVVQQAAERAKDARDRAQARMSEAKVMDKTADALVAVAKATPKPLQEAASAAIDKGEAMYDKGKAAVIAPVAQRLDEAQARFKKSIELYTKKKVLRVATRLVNQIPKHVKAGLEDDDMPRCASGAKDRIVDACWPDVREEILWQVVYNLDRVGFKDRNLQPREPEDSPSCCLLAFFRYHLLPYDRSFWGKLRDPVFVIFTLVSVLPSPFVATLVFLFIFLVIDRGDEYQLVDFILRFKGTQFVSLGVIRCTVGFFLYFACVTAPPNKNGIGGASEEEHNCENAGPGVSDEYTSTLVTWILQVVLMWVAFLMLPWSKKKGRELKYGTIREDDTQLPAEEDTSRGGHIRPMMLYDSACFVLCFILWIVMAAQRKEYDDWPVQQTLFVCQVIYGYLSLPFLLLRAPLVDRALTHAHPTGYDSKGRCRQLKRPEPQIIEPDEEKDEDLVNNNEQQQLWRRVRAALNGEQDVDDEVEVELQEECLLPLPASKAGAAAGGSSTAPASTQLGWSQQGQKKEADAVHPMNPLKE